MAQVSYGTITITDTTDIERIYVVYAKHTSNTDTSGLPNTNTWTESIASAPGSGNYIWQRTVVKKSGINESIYGNPVCITGPEGPQGDEARSIIAVTPYYYLSTSNSNQIGGSWSTTPQTYPSTGTYYYWTKTVTTYDSGNPSESEPVLDMFLTNAAKDARDANGTAQDAWNKADDAQTNASNALGMATSINQHFWSIETDYATGIPAGSYVTDTAIETYKSQKTGGNLLTRSDGIWIRNGINTLAALTGSSLNFYKPGTSNIAMLLTSASLVFNNPSTSNKAMELSSSGLVFYDGSAANGGNIQAQFGSSGAIQSGDYTIDAITDKFSRSGTKIDLTHGEIYSPYFRLSQGTVSGGPVAGIYISGTFEATGALIGYQKTSNSDTNAYWKIGYMTDINQDRLVLQRANDVGFIELAPSSTFIIQKNKIHTGWFGNNGYLTYPQFRVNSNDIYYDFGMNLPTSLTDKFLYVRYNTGSNLSTIYQNDSGWVYPFYVDAEGNINAHSISIDGVPMSGGSLIAGSLSSYGGTYNRPVYFPSDGTNKGKPVQTEVTDNTSSTAVSSTDSNLITARTLYYAGYVKSSGITSVTVAATSPVVSSTNTAQTGSSASTTISLANAYGDTKNPYGTKTKNYVLAGPTSGSAAAPTFRALVAADIPDLSETYLTSYDETDPIFTASAAYGITSSDITNWNGKTSNVGTVTKVSTGVGLVGGDITGSGTIKVNLRSETKLTNNSAAATETSGRVYPIVLDKSGYLAVNVPWTNVNSNYLTSSSTLNWNNVTTNRPTTLNGYGITDAKIANGVITLGSNTISKMPNPNALTIKVYNANTATAQGSTYSPTEVSYDGSASGKIASVAGTNAITNISAGAASGGTSTFTVVKADGSSSTFNVNISGAVVSGATILTDSSGNGLSVNGPVKFVNGIPETMRPTTTNNQFLRDDGTWATPTNTTYTFDGTYNASSNKAATVSTVTNAINALDGGTIGTPGAGKTVTAISQTNGNISVTFGNISITKSQISDFPTELTPASHTHGNIQDNGTLQTNDITIASGDKLVVTDSSNSDKIARASLAFTNSTTKFLREDGQFATPNYTTNTDSKVSSSNSSSKLFLVGTTSQSSSGQTGYSNSAVYATNGALVATTYNGLTLTKATTGFTIAGGTTSKTLTVNESYTLGAACAKGLSDSSSASAIGTGTNVTTERDIYYGLPTINNSHAYTSSTTIYAPTVGGTANTQALVGNGTTTAPKWVDISPSISITAGTASATPKINVTVLGQSGTAQSLTTASTSVYGATKLSSTSSSTEQGLAATPKLVYDSINSAASNYVAKSGDTMTGSLTTPELIATKIKADDVVTQLLTAEGIQTKNWTASNISTIDGSFYICPTISCISGTIKYTSNGGTLEMNAGSGYSFDVNSIFTKNNNSAAWTSNSWVMITGEVSINNEWIPIGTVRGKITATAPTTSKITIGNLTTNLTTDSSPKIIELMTNAYAHTFRNLKISLYSYYNNSRENLLGIMLTTAGAGNRTYIDIYDGSNKTNDKTSSSGFSYTEPMVRIGNLNGLNSYVQSGKFTVTPKGWGIYTTNGFFVGDVYAENGYIGGFTIGANDIHNGKTSKIEANNNGVWIGTDGIGFGKGITYFSTDGTGKIGPWDLSTTYIRNGNITGANNTTVAGVYLGTNGLNISGGSAANTAYIYKNGNTVSVNIGNKLTWDGSALSVNGAITATSLTINNTNYLNSITSIPTISTTADNASYSVEIEVKDIDYSTKKLILEAHVYKLGTRQTNTNLNDISFKWSYIKYNSNTGTDTETVLTTSSTYNTQTITINSNAELEATYICTISKT